MEAGRAAQDVSSEPARRPGATCWESVEHTLLRAPLSPRGGRGTAASRPGVCPGFLFKQVLTFRLLTLLPCEAAKSPRDTDGKENNVVPYTINSYTPVLAPPLGQLSVDFPMNPGLSCKRHKYVILYLRVKIIDLLHGSFKRFHSYCNPIWDIFKVY